MKIKYFVVVTFVIIAVGFATYAWKDIADKQTPAVDNIDAGIIVTLPEKGAIVPVPSVTSATPVKVAWKFSEYDDAKEVSLILVKSENKEDISPGIIVPNTGSAIFTVPAFIGTINKPSIPYRFFVQAVADGTKGEPPFGYSAEFFFLAHSQGGDR